MQTMNINDIIQRTGNLPAANIADSVNQALAESSSLVITAPPGAGKSTLLPLTIKYGCNSPLNGEGSGMQLDGKILMLEPRRLAARQIAERMANILGEPVGKSVGYRVRFDNKVSEDTQIEVLTEGILTRMLIDDMTLDGVDVVIFDEFHERSLNSDLALALVREAQEILRPDLKIVIMSATIDTDDICKKLQAPLVESEGKMFPVDIRYAEEDIDERDIAKDVVICILNAIRKSEGDVLAFLPGQGEITKCKELLDKALDNNSLSVYPLYGNLSSEEQRRAIAPSKEGERKIVLATPIAETSITIEGVRIVVDSGLCRSLKFDGRTGLSHLETIRISMDMANQRSGRAGRVAEGICYRLWTKATEHQMAEQRKPEILEADLSSLVLDCATFGEDNIFNMPWLTMPPTGNVSQAMQLLSSLGAITINTKDNSNLSKNIQSQTVAITPLGKQMAAMPCHPRIARMILSATSSETKMLACDIAALLEEKDPMMELADSDICLRIDALQHARTNNKLGIWKRIDQIAKDYQRIAGIKDCRKRDESKNRLKLNDGKNMPQKTAYKVDWMKVGTLLAYAYPERIAKSIDNIGNFRMASGNLMHIDTGDSLSAEPWIVIASLNDNGNLGSNLSSASAKGRVFLAAPLDINQLAEDSSLRGERCNKYNLIEERENISWDSKQGDVTMRLERRIGKLIVDSKPIQNADRQQVIDIICDAMKKEGLSMLDWNDSVQAMQRRVAQVAAWHPELGIPDISTAHLMQTASDWLPFYLEDNGKLKTSIAELRKLDLKEIIWNIIPYDLQQQIDRLAPTHWQVPTGSRIRIDYRQGAEAPVLSVRLQECFGMEKTPCVNDGQQPLLMELLSPGFKPVQLTQDLQSFWQGTYFEVRKELKRRYPKHYWPESPLEAEAVRGVKRK